MSFAENKSIVLHRQRTSVRNGSGFVGAPQLPSSWKIARLGDSCEIKTSTVDFSNLPHGGSTHAGGCPVLALKVSDMNRPGNQMHLRSAAIEFIASSEFIGRYAVPPQSIVFPKRGAAIATNKKRLTTTPAVLDPNLIAVIPPVSVDAEFLFHWFLTFDLGSLQEPGAVPQLNKKDLTPVEFPLPPLPEQRAIAAVLSKIQAAVEVQNKIVATLKELKAATMAKLFREGLRGEPPKQTEIGEIPESWEVVQLGSILAEPLRNGHSAVASMDHSGVRTLTLTAVTQRDFSPANTKVTTADPTRVQDLWLRDGDIFVERANTAEMVGLAALYRGSSDFAIFPDLLIRVRVDPEMVASDVLVEWLLSPWCRSYFQKYCRGAATSMPKIDHRTVEEVPVPIPRMDEQQRFVQTIRALDNRFSTARQRGEFLRLLFSSMLHLLMTGQVRVNSCSAA